MTMQMTIEDEKLQGKMALTLGRSWQVFAEQNWSISKLSGDYI
jgi:hypothetical protein